MEEQKIIKKLEEHDGQFQKINEKLLDHDKKFDKIETKLTDHDKKFDKFDSQVDFLATKAMEHDVQLEFLAVKSIEHDEKIDTLTGEIREFRNEMLGILDRQSVILERLDQERVFTNESMKRILKKDEDQDKAINRLQEAVFKA